MKHFRTFESFLNEKLSKPELSMMISKDNKDECYALLKKNGIYPKVSEPPHYGGDFEFEFDTEKIAQKAEDILATMED